LLFNDIIDNLPSCFLNLRLRTFFVCISESQDASSWGCNANSTVDLISSRITFHTLWISAVGYISYQCIFYVVLSKTTQTSKGIRRGGGKGDTTPRAPSHYGGAKLLRGASESPNNVASTFFNVVYLLPKDLKFEHGGAKLASCPGRRRHLTSLRPYKQVKSLQTMLWFYLLISKPAVMLF